jgi:hypothetical protein
MKQFEMFENQNADLNEKYTHNIAAPIYEPKNRKPHLLELYDFMKCNRLINEIIASNITDDEKKFLITAAKRHVKFNFSLIADYYAHSDKEMQNLMEKSALVIIDFKKAIELNYVKLSNEILQQFLSEKD